MSKNNFQERMLMLPNRLVRLIQNGNHHLFSIICINIPVWGTVKDTQSIWKIKKV